MSLSRRLTGLGLDGFVLSLMAAVGLAWLVPGLGRSGGVLHIDAVATYGVALIFLLYGLTLSAARLKDGALNWRLHILVLSSTFLLFPLLVWAATWATGDHLSPTLKLGFFFLAALPSTISSSVAMTSIARGNVAGAIFNATLSSLVGVVLTPLWVNAYLRAGGQSLPLADVLIKLLLLVALPIAVGQLLRPRLLPFVTRHMAVLRHCDRLIILAIVFNSFSDSVADGVWRGQGVGTMASVGAASLVLFLAVFGLLSATCRGLGFNREDRIAGVFCGTKKSLAAGVPMAKIMFGTSPLLGLIIVPTIVYHLIQLIVAGILARQFQRDG